MKISRALTVLVLLAACNGSTKTTPGGLEFKVVNTGDGTVPAAEQLIVFNYKMVDSEDSVWIDTWERGLPEVTSLDALNQKESEDEFLQMLKMSSQGDSIFFEMPISKFFRDFVKNTVPPQIDSTMDIRYHVKVEEIMDRDKFDEFRERALARYDAMEKTKSAAQMGKDTVAIDQYLAEKGIDANRTASGMRYVITKAGQGDNVASGQTAKVDYTGYLLDGTYFDTSNKQVAQAKGLYTPMREPYGPIDITVDQSSVIEGWHEAIKLMSKGSKATFYIPSPLAYKSQRRSDVIKENTILVFDMEIVDVK